MSNKQEVTQVSINRVVICDYCGKGARLVTGGQIYPHRKDLSGLFFWACDPCGAFVGCHKNSDAIPLGRLANTELRAAKRLAHAAFDPVWQGGEMHRRDAYSWLAEQLNIHGSKCHIGMFDVPMCRQVIELMKNRKK